MHLVQHPRQEDKILFNRLNYKLMEQIDFQKEKVCILIIFNLINIILILLVLVLMFIRFHYYLKIINHLELVTFLDLIVSI